MNDTSNNPAELASVEEMVTASLSSVRQSIHQRHEKIKSRIRQSPTAAVLGAVGVGYVLHRLPVRAILVTQVRVLSALAAPSLFLFGAAKLLNFLQGRDISKRE